METIFVHQQKEGKTGVKRENSANTLVLISNQINTC